MKINAIKCKKCKDVLYSRARHDLRWCSCNSVGVDGGFEYQKLLYETEEPERLIIDVNAEKSDLYFDWTWNHDKFGLIKEQVAE